MKKKLIVLCMAFFITGFAAAQIGPGRTLYVAVKTVELKSSAGLFSSAVATLRYGDQVTATRVNGKLVEVRSAEDPSLTGWAAAVNFSTKRIISETAATASEKEIALAGKGFNQELESSYQSKGELNFADVDKVEAITADEAELNRFIEEGRLLTAE
jgi:hypothetical protein